MEQLEKILPNIFNDVTNLSQVCEEFIKSCLDEVSDLRFQSISICYLIKEFQVKRHDASPVTYKHFIKVQVLNVFSLFLNSM